MAEVEEDYESVAAEFYKAIQNSAQEQEKVLEQILRNNSKCEYLQRHGLNGRTDAKSFKELLPVIDYEAIEQDLHRILQGDTSPILTSEIILHFYVSSGTTSGKRKVFPVTILRSLQHLRATSYVEAFRRLSPVGKGLAGFGMNFATVGRKTIAPGGLEMAAGTTFLFSNADSYHFLRNLSSPYEVVLCQDYRQSTYCHLVCGLLRSSAVTNIGAVFASGLAFAFSLLKELWQEMSRDIEKGHLSSLVTDPSARAAVTKLLAAPNPQLANLVRAECGRKSWEGILLRLWPNAKFIHCIATGSMAQYVDYINFLTDAQLPIISSEYGGSEGLYGLNPCVLNPPDETFYVMTPNQSVYFEFLPVRREPHSGDVKQQLEEMSLKEEERPVDLAAVKEGQEYELVVSNGEGLWRYKVGDMVQCVGFHHHAPKFRFLGRQSVILSIHTDKTEEKELLEVVNKAAKLHLPASARLYDFTSCASLTSLPGHYVIFWEVSEGNSASGTGAAPILRVGDHVLAEACLTMEAALSEPYRRGRNIGTIAPLELKIVRPGTFARLRQAAVDLGSSPAQYKTPRGYNAGSPALDILNAAVTESFSSPRSPPHPALNPVGAVISDI